MPVPATDRVLKEHRHLLAQLSRRLDQMEQRVPAARADTQVAALRRELELLDERTRVLAPQRQKSLERRLGALEAGVGEAVVETASGSAVIDQAASLAAQASAARAALQGLENRVEVLEARLDARPEEAASVQELRERVARLERRGRTDAIAEVDVLRGRLVRLTETLRAWKEALEPRLGALEASAHVAGEATGEKAAQTAEGPERVDGAALPRLDALEERVTTLAEASRKRVATLESQLAAGQEAHAEALVAQRRGYEAELASLQRMHEAALANLAEKLAAQTRAQERRLEGLREAIEGLSSRPASAPRASARSVPDLRAVKGIGPKYAAALQAEGVEDPASIAAWSADRIETLAATLGVSRKRLEGWQAAARQLTSAQSGS